MQGMGGCAAGLPDFNHNETKGTKGRLRAVSGGLPGILTQRTAEAGRRSGRRQQQLVSIL